MKGFIAVFIEIEENVNICVELDAVSLELVGYSDNLETNEYIEYQSRYGKYSDLLVLHILTDNSKPFIRIKECNGFEEFIGRSKYVKENYERILTSALTNANSIKQNVNI